MFQCWSWNSNTLATWCEELTPWKIPWCLEGLGAGGEGDNRGWDGWMASLTQWMWVWASSGSWWWTEEPGMLQSMGSQGVRHDWVTELNWTENFQTPENTRIASLPIHFSLSLHLTSSICHSYAYPWHRVYVVPTIWINLKSVICLVWWLFSRIKPPWLLWSCLFVCFYSFTAPFVIGTILSSLKLVQSSSVGWKGHSKQSQGPFF